MGYTEKFKKLVVDNKVDIIILIGLFLLAFGLRAIPSENPDFKGVYGFDPTWHARMIRFVVLNGYRPMHDDIAYWPDHPLIDDPPLYHYLSAYFYELVALITKGSSAYNADLFFKTVAFIPALSGALGVVAMYFLGKEVRGRKAGMIAALFFMMQSTHLFRSMYGFSEEDALGIALTLFTLAAYVWALKKGTWKHGVIAGLALLSLMMTWTFYPFTLAFLALFLVVNSLFMMVSKNYWKIESNLQVFGASLAPMALMPLFAIAWNWYMPAVITEIIQWSGFFLPVILFLGLLSYYFNYYKKDIKTTTGLNKRKAYQIGLAVLIIIGSIFLVWKGVWMVDYVNKLMGNVGQGSKLMHTVGEEHPKTLAGVMSELRWLALPFWLGLFYLPFRRLMKRKDPYNMDLIPFFFAAITFYLYVNKGKMGYIFGPGEMLLLGVLFADFIGLGNWLVKNDRASKSSGEIIKAVVMGIVVALFFTQFGLGFAAMEQQKVSYLPQPEWNQMYDYLKSLPDKNNVVLMTWWDYGHWTAWNGIKAPVDNTNVNQTKVIATAKIFTDFRANSSRELEEKHFSRMKAWGVTHVAVDRTLLVSKWGALTFLADNNCIPTDDLKRYGLSFPTLTDVTERYGICRGSAACPTGHYCTFSGEIGMANCQPIEVKTEAGPKYYVECNLFKDAPLKLTMQEWRDIVNARWPGYDLTLPIGGGTRTLKVYGTPDYKLLFFKVGNAILDDAPINHMLGFRWFFKDPTLKHSKLIVSSKYNLPNREVVLYKINYNLNETGNVTNMSVNPFNT